MNLKQNLHNTLLKNYWTRNQPDLLICRTEKNFQKIQKKISLFCNLSLDSVLMLENAQTIYEVPLKLYNEGLLRKLKLYFSLKNKKINLDFWNKFYQKFVLLKKEVNVAIVGKYTNLSESYKSLNEALFHSGILNNTRVKISWIDSRKIKDFNKTQKTLKNFQGILVPGGFGKRVHQEKLMQLNLQKHLIFLFRDMFWNAISYYCH